MHKLCSTFISQGLAQDKITLLNVSHFKDYARCIAESTLTVSMRYHGVVLSIEQGTPFISIAYENKMLEACHYSEMLNFSFSLNNNDFSQQDLVKAYQNAYKDKEKISQKLKSKLPILSELSKLPIGYLYLRSLEIEAQRMAS